MSDIDLHPGILEIVDVKGGAGLLDAPIRGAQVDAIDMLAMIDTAKRELVTLGPGVMRRRTPRPIV